MKLAERFAAGLLLIALVAVAGLIVPEFRRPSDPAAEPSAPYLTVNPALAMRSGGLLAHVTDAEAITARLIPNPFAIETLFAQPPAASSVRLTAPYRVTVGAAAVQLTASGNVNGGVCIKALVPGQTMYLGVSSAVTTATGWPMTDNESLCLGVRNANEIYAIASAAAQAVAVLPFSR